VLAFQNCYNEFRDRNCNLVFISVDSKQTLWHWQNTPPNHGGLGKVDIPLLSDASRKIGKDYGVLIEEEGTCLRAMFIIDGEGIVQQVRASPLQFMYALGESKVA
jgi:alkyl hydroperoxide reductase subunit AhpC